MPMPPKSNTTVSLPKSIMEFLVFSVMIHKQSLNGLLLNLKKSKAMPLGSGAYILSNQLNSKNFPCIHVNNNPLQYVNLSKNLALYVTPTLDWKAHVEHILKTVRSSFRSLHFYRKSLSFSLKKKTLIALSFVLPHFHYASITFIDLDKYELHNSK